MPPEVASIWVVEGQFSYKRAYCQPSSLSPPRGATHRIFGGSYPAYAYFIGSELAPYTELVARGVRIRVAHLRISLVLSGEGDILCRLLPWFKVDLGVALDSGYQCMSWIAIGDLNSATNEILCNKSLSGPINICAPNPIINRKLTKAFNHENKKFVFPDSGTLNHLSDHDGKIFPNPS